MRSLLFPLEGWVYRVLVRPLFFRIDPERIHVLMLGVGRLLGRFPPLRVLTRLLFAFRHSSLEQSVCGIRFPNPVGLAAGFDKNGVLLRILPPVGFGFAELGSVTLRPCAGNPPPRLFRLKRSKGIVVHYGLRNDGVRRFIERLRPRTPAIPIGVSVARTNDGSCADEETSRRDYVECLRALRDAETADYYTVNVSCPNERDVGMFFRPQSLARLLDDIAVLKLEQPLFVKLPVDLPWEEFHSLLHVVASHGCSGVIIANLTKQRQSPRLLDAIPETMKGGISGKPMADLSDALIAATYRAYRDRLTIIGVGGIFSAEDAYRKIRLGASLVQLITGMIYEGPQLIGEINRGMARLLKRDGFETIAEAVGADHR